MRAQQLILLALNLVLRLLPSRKERGMWEGGRVEKRESAKQQKSQGCQAMEPEVQELAGGGLGASDRVRILTPVCAREEASFGSMERAAETCCPPSVPCILGCVPCIKGLRGMPGHTYLVSSAPPKTKTTGK